MEKFKFGDKVICKRFNNPKLCTFIRYDYDIGYDNNNECILKFGKEKWYMRASEKDLEME